MFAVKASLPALELLKVIVYSSMCIEVKTSSFTNLSLRMIASSKPYPFQVVRATRTFLPRASSPRLKEVESVNSEPCFILCPTLTTGL